MIEKYSARNMYRKYADKTTFDQNMSTRCIGKASESRFRPTLDTRDDQSPMLRTL